MQFSVVFDKHQQFQWLRNSLALHAHVYVWWRHWSLNRIRIFKISLLPPFPFSDFRPTNKPTAFEWMCFVYNHLRIGQWPELWSVVMCVTICFDGRIDVFLHDWFFVLSQIVFVSNWFHHWFVHSPPVLIFFLVLCLLNFLGTF